MSHKQSIFAAVRVRNLTTSEQLNDHSCITTEGNKITLTGSSSLKHFEVPLLFPQNTSQQIVFQSMLQPLADDLLKGYSCAFICCGQNGSGKSFTIEGGDSQQTKGVVQRLLDYLTHKFQSEQNKNRVNLLQVSYVDVFEQSIIDLLEVRRGKQPKIIQKGRSVQMTGIGLKHITHLSDLQDFFALGNRKRRFAYKKRKRNSHKTSSIFSIHFESCTKGTKQEIKRGKLHIVDMCSSVINPPPLRNQYDLSVNSFRNVAYALVFGQGSKIPYHDSKVTLFLRQYLGGYGRTHVLYHLSPASINFNASLQSIKMVKILSQIQNYPDCQPDPSQMIITRRLDQLQQAKQKLKEIQKQRKKLKQMAENIPEQQQNGNDNQFLSKSFISKKKLEEIQQSIQHCNIQRERLKKIIQSLQILFLHVQQTKNVGNMFSYQEKNSNYASQQVRKRDFSQNDPFQSTSRSNRQEIFQLQKQFQCQRSILLQRIRQLQKEYQFYQNVTQQAVKRQEIDILRHSSQYDETKRQYEVPQFAITNKKLSFGSRFFSPLAKPSVSRTFMISSARSNQFPSPPSSKISSSIGVVRQIKSGFESKKANIGKRKPEKKKQNQNLKTQNQKKIEDEYQLGTLKVQNHTEKKQMVKSASSSVFRHLSRLKFK